MDSYNRQPREGDAWWQMQLDNNYNKLYLAAKDGNLQQAEEALATGIDINAVHSDRSKGFQVLHIASTKGHVNIIHFLLSNGADVNGRDFDPDGSSTPLFAATAYTQVDAVRALLSAGADVNARCRLDGTALHVVFGNRTEVKQSHIDIICLLLDHGIDINSEALKYGGTVIHQAVRRGHECLIKLLIGRGASLQGCLHASAAASRPRVVSLLLDAGANVRTTNHNGETPLIKFSSYLAKPTPYWWEYNQRIETLKMLIRAGVEINAKDAKGRTALHALAGDRSYDQYENKLMGARVLLGNGIDVWARDEEGKTAADLLLLGGSGDKDLARALSGWMNLRGENRLVKKCRRR